MMTDEGSNDSNLLSKKSYYIGEKYIKQLYNCIYSKLKQAETKLKNP